MSLNQSRSDKSESQYRKSGRSGSSGQQKSFAGGAGKGGGGTAPPQSPSINTSSPLSGSRSLKKPNGQGGHSRVSNTSANLEPKTATAPRNVQNGVHVQSPLQGSSDAPVSGAAVKPTDPSTYRTTRAVPRAPSSQSSSGASATTPPNPAKGDVSRNFPLQFGTINFMNGMQIPARTSSAPPNIDEQKRDQARHDSFKSEPTLPIPSVPKHQPKKDVTSINASNTGESHSSSQAKRDVQSHAPIASAAIQTQHSPVIPITGISMSMPFQQPQGPIQFGGANPQIQPTAASLQMPMSLPVGNASQMQQQVFSLQSHPLPPQGLIHQGQSLSFAPQMGHQLGPQMGNLGIGMNPQFAQQQAGKFGGPRKAVKITDPKTHEELRLDKRADPYMDAGSVGIRSQNNLPSQSQPIPSFATHQINYYSPVQPNTYNSPSIYFQNPTSLPLTSTQMTSGSPASRFNYPAGQGPQSALFVNPSSVNSLPVTKTGPTMRGNAEMSNSEHLHDSRTITSAPASIQVTLKPASGSYGEKIGSSSVSISAPVVSKDESAKVLRAAREASSIPSQKDPEFLTESSMRQSRALPEASPFNQSHVISKHSASASVAVSVERISSISFASTPSEDTASLLSNNEGRRRETVRRSDSFKDNQKNLSKKDLRQSQSLHQVDASDSTSSPKSSSLITSTDDVKSGDTIPVPPQMVIEPSSTILSLPSLGLEEGYSSSQHGADESLNGRTILAPSETSECLLGPIRKQLTDATDASEALTDSVELGKMSTEEPLDTSGCGTVSDGSGTVHHVKEGDHVLQMSQLKNEPVTVENKTKLPEGTKQEDSNFEILLVSDSSRSSEISKQGDEDAHLKVPVDNEHGIGTVEPEQGEPMKELAGCGLENDRTTVNLVGSITASSDSIEAEAASGLVSSLASHEDKTYTLDSCKSINTKEVATMDPGVNQELAPIPTSISSEAASKAEARGVEDTGSGPISTQVSASREKLTLESNRAKNTTSKGKKKRKEILQKADAAGSHSDLYVAYKALDEKTESTVSSDSLDGISVVDSKQLSVDATEKDLVADEDDRQSKAEPDDWEDAADISTPQLKTSEKGEQVHGGMLHHDEDANGVMGKKKYSRDFLLTFSEQCTNLPVEFEITSDIADILMGSKIITPNLLDREIRVIDRPTGVSRPERRGSVIMEDDKWSKSPGPFPYVKDPRVDIGHGGNVIGFRPGQGVNHGVLRNPRGQTHGQHGGGILSAPMQSMASQGGQRVDADRWQRANVFQKGLIPSPQTPLQVMHKAEKKYEVGKVSDEEQAKQRQLKGILNKLTPQNFEKLFIQVKEVNIDNAITLTGVISQIFDKALMEPTFCEMYANFCYHLAGELPDFSEDNEKITFKRLLLNKCQEEFERGEREQAEANRDEEEGEIKQSKEEREEKKIKARRRMLGNIRLIGELYKKKMLTERIMHECIKKLLGQYQNPDEEDVEALCKLMSTIGEMIDHPKAKEHMDAYFDMMMKLSNNMKLSSRVRFMLRDAIDLRKNKWQQRRKVEGPKKIEEVHRDAAQERHAQTSRLARGPSINPSGRRGQPMDFAPRGSSMLASPNAQMSGFRGMPSQIRGFGTQDVRAEERNPYESRTLSVPLPQRPIDDESITLGPQGGLARGMSIRGQPLMPSVPLVDNSSSTGDSRKISAGPNGYNSASEWTPYSSREELLPRSIPERFTGPPACDQPSSQGRGMYSGNRDSRTGDRSFDRSMATATAPWVQGSAVTERSVHSEKVWPEEHLRDMSIAAIKEFYSAKEEEEVARRIKELNAPSYYPSMISLWITHSFDRKDMERDLLAKLLVNLVRARDHIFSQFQLIKGFESVLESLEDAVSDAPLAAEYLGRIFAKIILENVIPLKEIGRLIHDGGEEPGRLLKIGLGSEVLGSILEIIRLEKGESVFNEIRASSNLRLEDFRPPDSSSKWKKLEAFL